MTSTQQSPEPTRPTVIDFQVPGPSRLSVNSASTVVNVIHEESDEETYSDIMPQEATGLQRSGTISTVSIAPTQDKTQDDQEVTDSDDNFPFSSLLGQHTAQFTGNGIPTINTPIISQIKQSVCQTIWSNKYVELGLLLPNSINSSTNQAYTLQMDNTSNISLAPCNKTRKIHNIESWTSAFIRYMAVYASKFPLKIPALLKYAEIVRDIASRKPGHSFLYYDTQFRQARETIPLPWDRIHTELWVMASTAYQQPSVISN